MENTTNKASTSSKNKTKEKPQPNRQRNINLNFRVTAEEKALIDKRVAQTGMSNLRAYMVKMAIDGRVIHVELDSVKEMVRLLSNATNNINQVTRKTHETGNFHAKDLEILQEEVESIWGQVQVVLQKIGKL